VRRSRAAAAGAALTAALLVQGGGASAQPGDEVIIGVSGDTQTAISPDGANRYETPWLLAGDRDVAVSPDGTRAAFSSSRTGNPEIHVADLATGSVARLTDSPAVEDRRPAWSADGAQLAWDAGSAGDRRIVVSAPDAGAPVQPVTPEGAEDIEPTWSPDGTRIAFSSDREGPRRLWSVETATGAVAELPAPAGTVRAPSWSPAGRAIAVAVANDGTSAIWRVEVATGRATRLTRGPGLRSAPDWSPDGRRITYAFSDRLDRSLRVVSAGGGVERPLPGTVGHTDPDWSTGGGMLTPTPELLPDLDQRAPTQVQVLLVDGAWRVGFGSTTDNVGDGPLWIRGTRGAGPAPTMRADQLIELRGGGTRVARGVGRMRFEYHAPHFHWHFQPFVRYELRTAGDHRLLVRDRKTGFCLIDRVSNRLARIPNVGPPRFTDDCEYQNRSARSVVTGSSRGYSDIYPAFYHGQDISLTGVPDGRYVLVQRVNPENRLRELRYGNNAASVLIRLTRPDGPGTRPRLRILSRCEHTEFCAGPPPPPELSVIGD